MKTFDERLAEQRERIPRASKAAIRQDPLYQQGYADGLQRRAAALRELAEQMAALQAELRAVMRKLASMEHSAKVRARIADRRGAIS